MNTELKNTMEKTVELGKKLGADGTDIILSTGKSFSLSAQNAEIDKYKISGSHILGIRAIKDNKVGICYTETFDDDSLERTVKSAIENAQSSDVNEFENINIKESDIVKGCEFQKDTSTTEEKIDFTLKLESEVKGRDSRVQSVPYNGFSEVESESYYLNSLGTFAFDSEYYQSCYTSCLLNEGKENSMHYHGVIGRKLSELDLESCITESMEHAANWMTAGPVKTGKYDIIFELDCMSEVLGCFGNIYSAKAAWEKTNPFAEKLGQKIASDLLTIKDIPQFTDAFFKYNFDSEGVLRKDLTLIENGELQSFYHNTATANYFKTQTTGHASRGAKNALGVGGTTKVISAGKSKESDVTSGEYLEVVSLQGLHSGANAISGEFSFGASGYLCKDGKRVQPVKGITVAGNFHKMLLEIEALGDNLRHTSDKTFFSPLVRFGGLSVAGN